MTVKKSIYSYTLDELEKEFVDIGIKKYIASQIYDWIYKKMINNTKLMSNISQQNIEIISKNFSFEKHKIKEIKKDEDGTVKFLFELIDGNVIEMAIINFEFGYSGCASSQIGCNMGCKFCASGLLKKKRNLEPYEMVLEILQANEYLLKNNLKPMGSMSFMGIGEPLDNYDNLLKTIKILHEKKGCNIGMRSFTLSTCGLVDKLKVIANDLPQCNLAISLHAPNNEIRNKLIPINKIYNIETVIKCAKEYTETTRNDLTFQYALIKDINDSEECAVQLSKLLKNVYCHVTLIEYNKVDEFPWLPSEKVEKFKATLIRNGISVSLRPKMGKKINAACGTMRSQYLKNK